MRIGIVCEGPTDAVAIERFVRESMLARGTSTEFIRLQPENDHTQGGWTNMLLWLDKNPPAVRVRAYFQGLFHGDLGAKKCDAIVLQLDTDILSWPKFHEIAKDKFGVTVEESPSPAARGKHITRLIEVVGRFDELGAADVARHVVAPAVETTETWCVGVFRTYKAGDLEAVRGDALRQEFMSVLHKSESNPDAGPYSGTDKSIDRRRRFCEKHAGGHARLESQCLHYRNLVIKLTNLAT